MGWCVSFNHLYLHKIESDSPEEHRLLVLVQQQMVKPYLVMCVAIYITMYNSLHGTESWVEYEATCDDNKTHYTVYVK